MSDVYNEEKIIDFIKVSKDILENNKNQPKSNITELIKKEVLKRVKNDPKKINIK